MRLECDIVETVSRAELTADVTPSEPSSTLVLFKRSEEREVPCDSVRDARSGGDDHQAGEGAPESVSRIE